MKYRSILAQLSFLLLIIALAGFIPGCGDDGDDGATGAPGAPGTSTGTLSGVVTNNVTGSAVAGVDIKTDPDVGAATQTDASGNYSLSLPVGAYRITYVKTNFTAQTQEASVVAGGSTSKNIKLVPVSNVIVNAGADQTSTVGGTVTLKATVEVLDGSDPSTATYSWAQTEGTAATITGGDTATAKAELGGAAEYKETLFMHSEAHYGNDPVTGEPLYENLDRWMVQSVTPLSLEESEAVTFKVTVNVGGKTYSDSVNVAVPFSFAAVNTGINNVPTGVPVLLHGMNQAGYAWTLAAPAGSTAAFDDATAQNPSFKPDVRGQYTATETTSGASIIVFAGTWVGIIDGQDADGRPVWDSSCGFCHNDQLAPDEFTPWSKSGHAEIFSDNLNTSDHYSTSCFVCHTVGYNTAVSNNGIDDQSDYQAFLSSDLLPTINSQNWTKMLNQFPKSARLANIQCENCHGPQNSQAHTNGAARANLASEVCGTCHGEPLRHARYQQWLESGHSNFEVAEAEGISGGAVRTSCGGCHSGQGFLQWYQQLQGIVLTSLDGCGVGLPRTTGSRTLDQASIDCLTGVNITNVQPQTCAVCHEPHDPGDTSGEPNTATVRVEGNTSLLPSGFMANGVGRGAVCITCHNSRNGEPVSGAGNPTLHEDGDVNFGNAVSGNPASYAAPHEACQGDVLMGRNAYFYGSGAIGQRSPHSFIADTCAGCHMVLTPPPPDLSYNLSGTNHSFAASKTICKDCHGAFDGGTIQQAYDETLAALNQEVSDAIWRLLGAPAGTTVVFVPGRIPRVIVNGVQDDLVNVIGAANLDQWNMIIAKANWNFELLATDSSRGIHNPGFTSAVAAATMNAVMSVPVRVAP